MRGALHNFSSADWANLVVILFLQVLIIYSEFYYLNKRSVFINLVNAFTILTNLRESLFLGGKLDNTGYLKLDLEKEFLEAVKYSQFAVNKFLGLFSYYSLAPSYLYLLWISKKESKPEKNTQTLPDESK